MKNRHRLKLPAADGKDYLTDFATAETPPNTKAGRGIAKQARKQLESQTGKSVAQGRTTWRRGCERFSEAFAEEAVGSVGGLRGRWRGIESLDSDGQMLYI